jgi:hypothetical protein
MPEKAWRQIPFTQVHLRIRGGAIGLAVVAVDAFAVEGDQEKAGNNPEATPD